MYKALLLTACLLLGSCGNVGVERYAAEQPRLDLAAFFSRPVQAWECSKSAPEKWSSAL